MKHSTQHQTHSTRAFSLIELMIVIAIIGVLAAVAVSSYSTYKTKVRLHNLVTYATEIVNASNIYYTMHGQWPLPYQIGYQPIQNTSANGSFTDLSVFNDPAVGNAWLQPGTSNAVGTNPCILDLTIWYSGTVMGTTNNAIGAVHIDSGANNGVFYQVCTVENNNDPIGADALSDICQIGGYQMPGYMENWSCP